VFIEPCVPTEKKTPPTGPNWLHEVKFDGFRVQIHSHPTLRVYSRNGRDFTQRFPLDAKLPPCIMDAEVVADVDDGGHDFYGLLGKRVPVTFWCFDLLSLRGRDLRALPLSERRECLERLLPATPLQFSEAFDDPLLLLEHAEEFRIEGVVSKRADLPYRSGRRPEWVKVKASWWREANEQRFEKMNRGR
jgi:bifunctional non-homologous end joining protein LigD